MKRVPLVLPLVFATGCALRPFTPSTTVAYHAQAVPPDHEVTLPQAKSLTGVWQLPADDPWMPFSKMTLLTAVGDEGGAVSLPDVEHLEVVKRARVAAARLAAAGIPPGTLLVLDLRGAASVAFASTLVERSSAPISPVLTFQHWPGENELIPAEETLAALLRYAPKSPLVGHGVPVFVLDSWRLAYRFDHPEDDAYDNRYFIQPADLPDPEMLLAHGRLFPTPIYSALAGFVEPGESLEEAVRREVREEVGVEIDEPRYVSSQPWPFPNSLMLGFYAEYAGGDIVIDPNEIVDAKWFHIDEMPPFPGSMSIASQLINGYIQMRRATR